ncbi:cytochrome P450 [Cubamyces sp. BRFM 1775]|nr:cytochrome P450 [Cubamyces sp. BRFM 1775]
MATAIPLLLVVAQATLLSLVVIIFYRLFLAPLSHLPGPKVCAITRLPLIYYEFSGQRRLWIHNLHLRYGPIVRIAPDEVSFTSCEAKKEIYSSGGSGYDKTSYYSLFEHFDTPNIFSTLERGRHAAVKKRFVERYNKTHVMRPEVSLVVQEHVEAFIGICAGEIGKSIDIYLLLHCFAIDSVTGHMFYPYGLHSLTEPRDFELMKELTFPSLLKEQYLRYYLPGFGRVLAQMTGYGRLRSDGLACVRYVQDTVRSAAVAPHTLLHKLRLYDNEDPDLRLAASECMDHLVAGLDTTGDALCFLMYHISRPALQSCQDRLREELLANLSVPLDNLPYLDALVKEGLRVYNPAPVSLPRHVPDGGRVIDGVWLPAGTIVSCQAHTLHRYDTRVFPDPDNFIPERWLDPQGVIERNQLFFAFGAGGRGCIGKHLALFEMKLLLKEVYSNFRTRIAPEMNASMEFDDQIATVRPKDQTCLLVFEKMEDLVW